MTTEDEQFQRNYQALRPFSGDAWLELVTPRLVLPQQRSELRWDRYVRSQFRISIRPENTNRT